MVCGDEPHKVREHKMHPLFETINHMSAISNVLKSRPYLLDEEINKADIEINPEIVNREWNFLFNPKFASALKEAMDKDGNTLDAWIEMIDLLSKRAVDINQQALSKIATFDDRQRIYRAQIEWVTFCRRYGKKKPSKKKFSIEVAERENVTHRTVLKWLQGL